MPSILSRFLRTHLVHNSPVSPSGSESSGDEDELHRDEATPTALTPRRSPADSLDSESTSSTLDSDISACPWVRSLKQDANGYEKALKNAGCLRAPGPRTQSSTDQEKLTTSACNHLVLDDLSEDEKASHKSMSLAHRPSPLSLEPEINRPVKSDDALQRLGPLQVLALLESEFGALGPPGNEKLLLEVDGVILIDVAVIGVIHVTNQRLAFHASLLESKTGSDDPYRSLKSGSATYHRPGFHHKRRIWLELTSTTLSAYVSSKLVDKATPLCIVLLGSVKEIKPVDHAQPRVLRIVRDTLRSHLHDYLEFDTTESANHWRQEIAGALFLYRHRGKEVASGNSMSTVRMSVPLVRIADVERNVQPDFSNIVTISISSATPGAYQQSDIQKLQIGPMISISQWDSLEGVICDAKFRHQRLCHDHGVDIEPPLFVDFGPISPWKASLSEATAPTVLTTNNITMALGLEPDADLWVVPSRIYGSLATSGYFVVSDSHVGFWCKNLATRDVKYRLSPTQILSVKPFRVNWFTFVALCISLQDGKELKLVFKNATVRDEAMTRIERLMSARKPTRLGSGSSTGSVWSNTSSSADISEGSYTSVLSSSPTSFSDTSRSEPSTDLSASPTTDATALLAPLSRTFHAASAARTRLSQDVRNRLPKAINLPRNALMSIEPLHFACLTIGSRGDVQPYIALGIRLREEGHQVTIITHEEYREWILQYGLGHRTAGGDPAKLMKLSVENKIMSPDFFKESMTNFRPWLDELLVEAWDACQDVDVLIESPSAMAGVHIAEALRIPYFRAFSMPWTKTTEFPHPFLSPPVPSPAFNSGSYVLFNNVMWAATSSQINKWRRNSLKLGNTDMGHLAQAKIVFIYFFSQAVVPKPLDWPDTVTLSGYWFLHGNSDPGWEPSQELLDWMALARADGKPIVYIGMGSVTVPRPKRMLGRLVRGVVKSGVRAILTKGWSERVMKEDTRDPDVVIPPECIVLDKVPHEWLFASIDAAMHHGGAGTTAASLRAGIPTIIKPWFGDQFFWASRVEALGAGLKAPNLKSSTVARVLMQATTDTAMRAKAMAIGQRIRAEDGVHNAIYTIYTYLHRAGKDRKSLNMELYGS